MAREKFVSDVTDELRSMQAVNVKVIDHPKQKISATTNINKYGSLIKVLKISFCFQICEHYLSENLQETFH